MRSWDRFRDGVDEVRLAIESATLPAAQKSGKLSGAPAPPQPHPTPPQAGVAPTRERGPGHRRPLGVGEVDLHVRLPAVYRQRLKVWRRERGLTLSAAVADMVRRGLEQPPPRRSGSGLAEARPGLVQEAALAGLLAIEQTRLYLEAVVPAADGDEDDLVSRAALAAEDRLAIARRALEVVECLAPARSSA